MKSHQVSDQKRRGTGKRLLPLPWVILFDLVLLAAGLMTFSLFHHVLVRDVQTTGLSLPRPANATAQETENDTAANVTDDATKATVPSIVQSSPSGTNESATGTSETVADPTAEPNIDPNDWRVKFAGQFTDGDIIRTETEYRSANIAITVDQVQRGDAVYYLADIFLSDIEQFRTAFASGVYGRSLRDEVVDIAVDNNALLAISGDYYGIRDQGIVIRNGALYRDVLFQDVLIMYYDGSMETKTKADFSMDHILAEGAWQAWSFGPMLLDNSQPMTRFNSQVNPDNPRGAIGYYEPGHYCFVLVDGRQPGYSNGMTLTELSQLFYDLGCSAAYNLDGGESAVMTFMNQVANRPYKGGRQISDIVYIAETGSERTGP